MSYSEASTDRWWQRGWANLKQQRWALLFSILFRALPGGGIALAVFKLADDSARGRFNDDDMDERWTEAVTEWLRAGMLVPEEAGTALDALAGIPPSVLSRAEEAVETAVTYATVIAERLGHAGFAEWCRHYAYGPAPSADDPMDDSVIVRSAVAVRPAGAARIYPERLPSHLLALIAQGKDTEQWALYATAIAALTFGKAKGPHPLHTARDDTLANLAELIACLALAIMHRARGA